MDVQDLDAVVTLSEIMERLQRTAASREALRAGLGLVVLQQVTGQPSVLYYMTTLFDEYDMGIGASIGVSFWKLVATLVCVRFVDTYGRVPLLQSGSVVMAAALLVLVVVSAAVTAGGALAWTSVMTLSVYVGGYQARGGAH